MNLENMPMGIIENILQNRGRATIYACDDPVKTLAVGLDGKRAEVSPLQYVPAEGLNTPSVKQSVEKQECNYNECGK